MLGLLKNIFASPDSAAKVLDSVLKAGDSVFYTKEERAKTSAEARDWFIRYLEATQPQNLARRFIAIVVSLMWATLVIVGVAVYLLDKSYSTFIFQILNEVVNMPFTVILGFYFGGHALQKLLSGHKK